MREVNCPDWIATHWTEHFNKNKNNEQIYLNLDPLAEKRELALEIAVAYQQKIARYYNQKVQVRQFRIGD